MIYFIQGSFDHKEWHDITYERSFRLSQKLGIQTMAKTAIEVIRIDTYNGDCETVEGTRPPLNRHYLTRKAFVMNPEKPRWKKVWGTFTGPYT